MVFLQRRCEPGGAPHRHVPRRGVERDRRERAVPPQQGGRRRETPAGHPGQAVTAVADEREQVGDLLRADAVARAHGGLVGDDLADPIEHHHALAAHALVEVVVGRADHHLLDLRLGGEARRARGEQLVGLVATRRPHRHAERPNGGGGEWRLRGDHLVGAASLGGTGRRDHRVERDRDVRDVRIAQQCGDRVHEAPRGADLAAGGAASPRRAVEAPEQLERPVDEVDFHVVASSRRWVRTDLRTASTQPAATAIVKTNHCSA